MEIPNSEGAHSQNIDEEGIAATLEHAQLAENVRPGIRTPEETDSRDGREPRWSQAAEHRQDESAEENLTKSPHPSTNANCALLNLPIEVIDSILRLLSPADLDQIGFQCRKLYEMSSQDLIWKDHVQSSVPGCRLLGPSPFTTWRELYRAHDPHWFLTKHKIWFSDHLFTGKLILMRYNPKTACIEGFRVVSERIPQSPPAESWQYDNEVIIQAFAPHVKLHLDRRALVLSPNHVPFGEKPWPLSHEDTQGEKPKKRSVINSSILALHTAPEGHRRFRTFELCRNVRYYRQMAVWPPTTIPSLDRVRNDSNSKFESAGHRPFKLAEVSQSAFRTRTWLHNRSTHGFEFPNPFFIHTFLGSAAASTRHVRMMEEVDTFATLDPKLYTPTPSKPYRGLWVGDYSGHGCEFLLLHQPDDETPFDESKLVQKEDETSEEFKTRKEDEKIHRGSIQAIKLTGDPHVARGEYTFMADDIGQDGFIRYADDEKFKGARIVKCKGFLADEGGRNARDVESQLIMISPDKLAHYWEGLFGHINLYERVDINQFLDPANDPQPSREPWE